MKLNLPSLVRAAGGEIAGKVRLQKMVYLLDQLGLNSGASYEYHHYGPYSAELAEQANDDVIFCELVEESRRRKGDGVPYVTYRAQGKAPESLKGFQAAIDLMQGTTATVLELAATAHWLKVYERLPNWKAEIKRRKGVKTEGGRLEEALALLERLQLRIN